MAFDLKEKSMLAHYKNILEQRLFDEYDILGFLIFIRRHLLDGKYPYIKEFADLVAHRKRNQGKILDAISGAIKNQYQLIPGTAHVQGYVGMQYVDWEKEWQELGHEFDIQLNSSVILEISQCVFTLTQFTEYVINGHIGVVKLLRDEKNFYCLCTKENTSNSYYICFAKCGPFNFLEDRSCFFSQPVATVRSNGVLRLQDASGFIL